MSGLEYTLVNWPKRDDESALVTTLKATRARHGPTAGCSRRNDDTPASPLDAGPSRAVVAEVVDEAGARAQVTASWTQRFGRLRCH